MTMAVGLSSGRYCIALCADKAEYTLFKTILYLQLGQTSTNQGTTCSPPHAVVASRSGGTSPRI